MYDYQEVIGKKVFLSREGKEAGVVKDVLVSGKGHEVKGFIVREKKDVYLPYENVNSLNNDVMTASEGFDKKPEDGFMEGSGFKGLKVVTEKGRELGNIVTFYFDSGGHITHYEVSGGVFKDIAEGRGLMPGAGIKSHGPDAVIVKKETEEIVNQMKAGGAGAALRLKEFLKGMTNHFGAGGTGGGGEKDSRKKQ
ncbi:MAG: PRC-barrel domain-containing protein [Candidatus Goldiibacteriota bacterium]